MRIVVPLISISTLLAISMAGQEANQQSPRLLEAVAPVYPMVAVYSATTGDVAVRVEIDKSGLVTAAKAVDGHKLLQPAAETAAKLWRFAAGAGSREARLVFTFKISPKGTADSELATRFRPPYNIEIRRIIPEALTNRDPGAGVQDSGKKKP